MWDRNELAHGIGVAGPNGHMVKAVIGATGIARLRG